MADAAAQHTPRSRARGTARDAADSPRAGRSRERFALFAECLLAGVWLTVAALGVVTALPALAAACGHLRRHLEARPAGMRQFLADLGAALRTGWKVGLALPVLLAVLLLNVAIARSGLPGGSVVAVLTWAGVAAALVVAIRAAASFTPGARWRDLLADAGRRAVVTDPGGSLLLFGGLAVTVVAAGQMLPLVAPALGCLAAAAVAVERRLGR
ncbi:hypothetical protein [Allostreptomyces psammosilenae]|uniref:DUF624 domain-containing protein n=1 Tax=Allostreptomyces psammosilenae TaxID=1892865 RepID=A0A852ZST0_9ACTN|nr:hypothetical protein [Allostreptomyces psammosilenae]NYI04885.1 hypothetical protein [Allostreptomyces psammosilenae]